MRGNILKIKCANIYTILYLNLCCSKILTERLLGRSTLIQDSNKNGWMFEELYSYYSSLQIRLNGFLYIPKLQI